MRMSNSPTTRPDEMARLAEVAKDEQRFKIEMLLYVQESRNWRKNHEKEDDRRFTELKEQVSNQGGVVSGITTDRSELKGAWKALGIVIAAMISFAGAFAWLWANVFSTKGHP
jgi:hypothetical protein